MSWRIRELVITFTNSEFSNSPTMRFSYEEFDLSDVRTFPLASRRSKTRVEDFAKPAGSGPVAAFVDSLPDILAGADLKAVVRALGAAHRGDAGIVWGLGAHVIKTGVGPVLVDLMERGFVSAIATNGAGVIHDVETRPGRPYVGGCRRSARPWAVRDGRRDRDGC